MATIDASIAPARPARRADWLGRAATFCYLTIAAGQLLFVAFILLYYYTRTLTGNFAAWDDKPIITGFVAGDTAGNLFFAVHVLMAAVITFGGLVQLVPMIRSRWPALHRWNGRLYLLSALTLALGGLWMTWGRGTWLALGGAIGITLDALLIVVPVPFLRAVLAELRRSSPLGDPPVRGRQRGVVHARRLYGVGAGDRRRGDRQGDGRAVRPVPGLCQFAAPPRGRRALYARVGAWHPGGAQGSGRATGRQRPGHPGGQRGGVDGDVGSVYLGRR